MPKNSGIVQRTKDREKGQARRQAKARQITTQKLSLEILKQAQQTDDLQLVFNEMWQAIDTEIKNNKLFKSYGGYIEGYNEAVRHTQDIIEEQGLNVGFPKLIVSSERPKSFRSQSWFNDGKKTLDLYLSWVNTLAGIDYKITLSDIMLSLIFHSAVLKLPEIAEILSDIDTKTIQLNSIYGLPVVIIIIQNKDYHTNVMIDKEYKHQANVFLSPLTARLTDLYVKQDICNQFEENADVNVIYRSIWLSNFNGVSSEYIGINRFLLGAVYVLEEVFEISLPEHTWYLLTGLERSYGLSTQNWQSIIYGIQHVNCDEPTLVAKGVERTESNKKLDNTGLATDIAKILKAKGVEKVSVVKCEAALKDIYAELTANQAPLNELAIIGWLIKKTESCKVSSIRTYSHTIVFRWLSVSQGMDLMSFNQEDYLHFYTELIELGSTEKAKNSIATHIDDIHAFLVREFDIEPITPLSESARPHHKTGYISENMYQAILAGIDNNGLSANQEENNAIKLALMLGQRCGLRIGEIVKIRLKDISSDLSYLEIRDNRYGNNKTSSALRRVLLNTFLIDSDKQFMKQIYAKRNINNHDTLIVSQTGQSYRAQDLSKLISHFIKQATGLNQLTTHHLRHSCLTNLQLMSFLKDCPKVHSTHECFNLLYKLLPYNDTQVQSIIDTIQTPLSYKKIYALAAVAGHATPSTTFASYIHLVDFQIGLKLWHTDFCLKNQHAKVLGVSRREQTLLAKPEELNTYLMNKIRNNFHKISNPKSNKLTNASKTETKPRKYGFDEVTTILTKYTVNDDINHWLELLDIDESIFKVWLSNANTLKTHAKFRTQQSRSRLFDHKDNAKLLPRLDRFIEDREILSKMTAKYREVYYSRSKKRQRPLLEKFVLHTLTHSQYTKNYITFDNPIVLQDFLEIVVKLVYKKDLRLIVYNYSLCLNKDRKKWDKVLNVIKTSQITYKNDDLESTYRRTLRVELSLTSQTEEDRIAAKESLSTPISGWTVRTIQIFCHYVYIMIGDRIEIYQKE